MTLKGLWLNEIFRLAGCSRRLYRALGFHAKYAVFRVADRWSFLGALRDGLVSEDQVFGQRDGSLAPTSPYRLVGNPGCPPHEIWNIRLPSEKASDGVLRRAVKLPLLHRKIGGRQIEGGEPLVGCGE